MRQLILASMCGARPSTPRAHSSRVHVVQRSRARCRTSGCRWHHCSSRLLSSAGTEVEAAGVYAGTGCMYAPWARSAPAYSHDRGTCKVRVISAGSFRYGVAVREIRLVWAAALAVVAATGVHVRVGRRAQVLLVQ
jgi:hypothetical protein